MPPVGAPPRLGPVLLGIARVARGRKDGLALFGGTPQSVLSAFTPLVAFMLVGGLIALASRSRTAVGDVASVSISLLAPLVVSFEVARRWGRALEWFRFATAFCWCQWAAPAVLMLVLIAMAVLMAGGLDQDLTAGLGLAALFGYGVWLHWFLARHALDLSRGRALLLVVIVSVATTVLVLVPQLVFYAVNGLPPS